MTQGYYSECHFANVLRRMLPNSIFGDESETEGTGGGDIR